MDQTQVLGVTGQQYHETGQTREDLSSQSKYSLPADSDHLAVPTKQQQQRTSNIQIHDEVEEPVNYNETPRFNRNFSLMNLENRAQIFDTDGAELDTNGLKVKRIKQLGSGSQGEVYLCEA